MSSREPQQRGRKERFIVIPFSSTCRSAASVDVVQASKTQPQGAGQGGVTSAPAAAVVGKPAKTESLSLVARLLRGFKNLSHQIFAVHDEEDEEEEEQEMVIGLPTDVKHVAHIGWDGSTSTTTSLRSWNRAGPPDAASTSSSSSAAAPPPLPSQAQEPALSARQLELAMAAQASAAGTGAAATSASAASGSGSGATSSSSSTARRHRHYS